MQVYPGPVSDLSPEVLAFVLQAKAALGRELPIAEAFGFGDSPAMADELAALVLSGEKTATCGWPPSPEIVAGMCSVMLDGRGAPLAVIESLEVRELPFLEVEAQFAYDEGEGERTLEWWRDAHRRFFARQPEGADWNDDQLVQCERFRVVWQG
jgi:uncharacterized protein YhfF